MARAKAALARLPLRFEANQGQWRPDVRYGARSGGGALLLTERGAELVGGGGRVEITMLDGNTPRIEGLDPMPARTNYFVGSRAQWRTGITNFTRVAYRSIYRGIDVVYYGSHDQLEYDFVLKPGADPRSIRMRFRGASDVHLTAEGDLAVASAGAQFVQKKPVVYQEDPATSTRRPVEGRYELLAGGVVGVRVSGYDASKPLVIDPVVTYSIFVGGGSTDVVNAVATDSKGFIYVAGSTRNGDLIPYGNAVQSAYDSGIDGFIAMFDPNFGGDATWVYFTYLGGSRDDVVTAIKVDSSGLIYATGTTTSSDFPLAGANVSASLTLSSSSTATVFPSDAFVSIVSPTDGLEYSTYYGGSGNETPNGIDLDQNGLMYIFGTTESPDLPVTGAAYQSVLWGPSDTFLAVIDRNSPTLVYGTYLGGESEDDGRGLAVTPQGLVYFAASTYSQQFPFVGPAYRATPLGVENLVIGVIDPKQQGYASLVYCTYFGGSGIDEVRKLRLDANGKLLLTGWTLSPDFPVTANAMQPTFGGAGNAFIARVNPAALPNAFVEYASFLGGSGGEVGYDIINDASGNIYVTGYTLSTDFPVTKDAIQPQFGSGADTFLVKMNPGVAGKGALLYGTYLGGVGTHVGQGMALAPNGSLYLAGYTTPDWHLAGAQNIYNGGGSDGYVAVVK